MKLLYSVNLEFITPCFCSGANPQEPEIRPASIRGEFRRWLRIFGADLETESRIMGSAPNNNDEDDDKKTGGKSLLTFRVLNVKKAPPFTAWKNWKLAEIDKPGKGYLTFFLTRQNPMKECLAPETSFTLQLWLRKDLSEEEDNLVWEAWSAMIDFGSIGARTSRGFGAWVSDENKNADELPVELEGFERQRIPIPGATQERRFDTIGNLAKTIRKTNGYSGKKPSPMGYVDGKSRQKSIFIFRPVVSAREVALVILRFPEFYAPPKRKQKPGFRR